MTRTEHPRAAGRRLAGIAIAITLASASAWGSGRDQDRAMAARQPVPDTASVTPAARKSYDDFWKGLPKAKAEALEKELNTLEARQRRGEDVKPDLEKLRGTYPQLFEMSATSLQSARWILSSGGSTQAATCTGLGWIGRNGRLRCIGRLTT